MNYSKSPQRFIQRLHLFLNFLIFIPWHQCFVHLQTLIIRFCTRFCQLVILLVIRTKIPLHLKILEFGSEFRFVFNLWTWRWVLNHPKPWLQTTEYEHYNNFRKVSLNIVFSTLSILLKWNIVLKLHDE